MRILIVASWFPTPAAPVSGIFVAEQAAALAQHHEVTVLAPETTAKGASGRRRIESTGTCRVIRVAIPEGNHVHALRYTWTVIRELQSGAYDLAHAHVTLPGGFAAVLAGVMTGRPSVITEHMSPFHNLMRTTRDRAKVRYALHKASAAIAVSRGLRSQMQAHGIARPILVVPNLIDIQRFSPRPKPVRKPGEFHLLFIGRLNDRQKNLPALLRAVSRLASMGKESFYLRVIGDGGLRAENEQLARHLGIDARCEFAGFLSPEEVAGSLAACDMFVLPSFNENCPVVVAEALAAGRPVVVTRCGGSEEMVTPACGKAVPVDDPAALAGAILEVCRNLDSYPADRISAGAHARFGKDVVVGRLNEIYESVLPATTRRRPVAPVRVA